MRKETKKLFRPFFVIVLALAITLTSVPCSWTQVTAAVSKSQPVEFKSATYRQMCVGQTYDFDLVGKPSGAECTWSSSEKAVATVGKTGLVKAKSIGTTTITCKVTQKDKAIAELTAEVYVVESSTNPASKVTIDNKIASMAPGETYDFNESYESKDVSDYVNWTSSNTAVATVDKDGVVTAKADGTVKITAKAVCGKGKAKVAITVSETAKASSQQDEPTVDGGLDEKGRVVAVFGSPEVDGKVDDVWANAKTVNYTNVIPQAQKTTTTTATVRVMWDDNALYFLAQVADPDVSDASMNVYEKDSVEFFLDQDDKRNGTYEGDDSQFRINFKNELSCDHGDLSNLYSATATTEDGYIVEGRIALSVKPNNDVIMGMESQINCATGASREACISVFDKTGTAYQDTSKFGEVLLTGKTKDSVTKPNYYDLKSAVSMAEKIDLVRYANGDVVKALIVDSNKAMADSTTTQARYDKLLSKLNKAVDALIHSGEIFPDKECRDIPKKYKTTDPEEQRGTLEFVQYDTINYQTNETISKSMMVYLPKGYNPEDTTKKYNVFYLVHGMAENQFTPIGYPGSNNELVRVVDNLIAEGKMDPMIIVSPTWYLGDQNNSGDNLNDLVKNFRGELVETIIPLIEGKYNCYAESTSEADLKAARDHRAFGGFSMGGNCTWYRFIDSLDYFKYFVPVSMWAWLSDEECIEAGAVGETELERRANYLASIPAKYGYGPEDFYIFGATGTADLASPGMPDQIDAMKKESDVFKYSGDIRNGNLLFIHYPGGAHNWTCVDIYLYNFLPDLFKAPVSN